jgi:hypothetical protein
MFIHAPLWCFTDLASHSRMTDGDYQSLAMLPTQHTYHKMHDCGPSISTRI